jgi:ligand-binding sensor domain-containing protein
MKILFFFLAALMSIAGIVDAQNPQWINYTCGKEINALADDGNILWAGTSGGLVKYNKTTGISTFYNRANSGLPDNIVISIAIDGNGMMWIGTFGGGLAKFDGINWTTYDPSNSGLPDYNVRSLAIDENGTKWMACENYNSGYGLTKFDGVNWTTYDTSNSDIPWNNISSIAIDTNGNKWMGFSYTFISGGVSEFDGINWTNYYTSSPTFQVSSIVIDETGTKWIGTYHYSTYGNPIQGCGLRKFDGINWTIYDISNSGMPNSLIKTIAIDEDGTKWIGTHGGGLAVFNENGIPVSVKENITSKNNLILYPNPAKEMITISSPAITIPTVLSIFNVSGEKVIERQLNDNESQIDISALPRGVYFVRVWDEKMTEVMRVVKQ